MAKSESRGVLVTWVGDRDPNWVGPDGDRAEGPIQSFFGEIAPASIGADITTVHLFHTPGEARIPGTDGSKTYQQRANEVADWLRAKTNVRRVVPHQIKIANAANFNDVYLPTRAALVRLVQVEDRASRQGSVPSQWALHGLVSPGTPQQNWAFLGCVLEGIIGAKLWQVLEFDRARVDLPLIREVQVRTLFGPIAHKQLQRRLAQLRADRDALQEAIELLGAKTASAPLPHTFSAFPPGGVDLDDLLGQVRWNAVEIVSHSGDIDTERPRQSLADRLGVSLRTLQYHERTGAYQPRGQLARLAPGFLSAVWAWIREEGV